MLSCDICPLGATGVLEEIAEEGHRQVARAAIEEAFISTLQPEQRKLWLDLESAITHEINVVQTLTVKKLHCESCPKRTTCTN